MIELTLVILTLLTSFATSLITAIKTPTPTPKPQIVVSPTPTPTPTPKSTARPHPTPVPTVSATPKPPTTPSSTPKPSPSNTTAPSTPSPAPKSLYDKSNPSASVKVTASPSSKCPNELHSFVLQTQYYEPIFDNNSKDYTYVNTTGYEASFSNLYPGTYNVFFQYCGQTSTYYQVRPKANETVSVDIALH